jgi:hypothetical protein
MPDGNVGILSTAHAFGVTGEADLGREVEAGFGDGRSAIVASVHSVVRLRSGHKANLVDAAIAALGKNVDFIPTFNPSYELPTVRGSRSARLGESVYAVGARSGAMRGTIQLRQVAMMVNTDAGEVLFEDILGIIPERGGHFGEPGDSGALVIGVDGAALAVFFASASGAAFGFAFPLDAALSALSCQLIVNHR